MLADYAAMDSNDKGVRQCCLGCATGAASCIVPKSSDQGEPPAHPDPIAELVRIVGEPHADDPAELAFGLSGSSWPALFDCIAHRRLHLNGRFPDIGQR